MQYTHLSKESIEKFEEKIYPPFKKGFKEHARLKPYGFWYSINNGWEDWCEQENFGKYKHRYEVIIPEDKNIFKLQVNKIKEFCEEYYDKEDPLYSMVTFSRAIKWTLLKDKYDGFEIENYIRSFDLFDHLFYYAWDCSSGVLWNTHGVKIKLLTSSG